MELLREQKTINKSLRQYVDSILLKILEKNPNLLEKKKWNGGQQCVRMNETSAFPVCYLGSDILVFN